MNRSIKVLILITIVSLQSSWLRAQSIIKTTGVYLTEQDYKAGKLSYVPTTGDKLHLNAFLGGKHVSVISQGKKLSFDKDKIFGYRQDNRDHRFFKNEAYRIIDSAGFMLYGRNVLAQEAKGMKAAEQYYYSVHPSSPVLNLTVNNIENSFAVQTNFRYQVKDHFHSDGSLMAYDKDNNQYEIKHIYLKTTGTKQQASL